MLLAKVVQYIIILILEILLLASCVNNNKDNKHTSAIADTIKVLQTQDQSEVQAIEDSLMLVQALSDALDTAKQAGKVAFQKSFTANEAFAINVTIDAGFFFNNNYPHIIIRRNLPDVSYIDIYTFMNHDYIPVMQHIQAAATYVNDTIQDIDGDGLKDFVLNWYGNSGCCLKGFSEVWLLQNDKQTFSTVWTFINPTFSPQEHMVRGVCYGAAGATELYKFQWNKGHIDTIGYVSYEYNTKGIKTGKINISKVRPQESTYTVLKRLNVVPQEYTQIENYDWFTGDTK